MNKKSKIINANVSQNTKQKTSSTELLNFEIAEQNNCGILSVKKDASLELRDDAQERGIENRLIDKNLDAEGLNFRGLIDGTCHYLIWFLVFLMPVYVPYVYTYSGGSKSPALDKTLVAFVFLTPLLAFIYSAFSNSFQKNKVSNMRRNLYFTLISTVFLGLYFLANKMGFLPMLAYSSKLFTNTGTPNEFQQTAWFSTFSFGKYLLTYLLTILIVSSFLLQQFLNRDRVVLRLPLRKIFFSIFFIHILSFIYPLVNEGQSSSNDVLMRLHQWLQYFFLFVVLVNSMSSLGRMMSVARAASLAGGVVAFIGISQHFNASFGEFVDINFNNVDVFNTFVNMNPGQTAFSTFGQNNFSAAYVCLSIPITMALIFSLSAKFLTLIKASKKDSKIKSVGSTLYFVGSIILSLTSIFLFFTWTFSTHPGFLFLLGLSFMALRLLVKAMTSMPVADLVVGVLFWLIALLVQSLYLVVSMGKAGIVSMIGAVLITSIVGLYIVDSKRVKKVLKVGTSFTLGCLLIFLLLFAALSKTESKAVSINETLNSWELKLSKTFDTTEGSNRVRLFYVGSAFRIMKDSALSLAVGTGANNYRNHYPLHRHPEESSIEKGKSVSQAHCDYAQHAADLGLIGFFLFMILMIYPLVVGIRLLANETNVQRRFMALGFYCTLVAMSINCLFFFPFQTPGSLLPYFVSLALLFGFQREQLEFRKDKIITIILVSLLGLAFLLYEAWFSSRYYNASSSIWFINCSYVLLAWAVIYAARRLLNMIFKKDYFMISFKADPVVLAIFIFSYVIFAQQSSISYIMTDNINQTQLKIDMGTIQKGHSIAKSLISDYHKVVKQAKKDLKDPSQRKQLREREQEIKRMFLTKYRQFHGKYLEEVVRRMPMSFKRATTLNPNNHAVYETLTKAMQIYFSIVILPNEIGIPFQTETSQRYKFFDPFDKDNIFVKHLENTQLKLSPNNKNYYRTLVDFYLYWYQRYGNDNPMKTKIAEKIQLYSSKIIHINPNDNHANQSQIKRGQMLEAFLMTTHYLSNDSLVDEFFNKKIKGNFSSNHDICMILARHFNRQSQRFKDKKEIGFNLDKSKHYKDLELEARLQSFRTSPYDKSRVTPRGGDIAVLNTLLKQQMDSSSKAKYPNGIVDVLYMKRDKKTLIEHLIDNNKVFAGYQKLSFTLDKGKHYKELKAIQARQLVVQLDYLDLNREKALYNKCTLSKDFDTVITNILLSKQFKYTIRSAPKSKENFAYAMRLMINNGSKEALVRAEQILDVEIVHNFIRNCRYQTNSNTGERYVSSILGVQQLRDFYTKLKKEQGFVDYMTTIVKSKRIAARKASQDFLLSEVMKTK